MGRDFLDTLYIKIKVSGFFFNTPYRIHEILSAKYRQKRLDLMEICHSHPFLLFVLNEMLSFTCDL